MISHFFATPFQIHLDNYTSLYNFNNSYIDSSIFSLIYLSAFFKNLIELFFCSINILVTFL